MLCSACKKVNNSITVIVENELDINRNFETVEINLSDIFSISKNNAASTLLVTDINSNKEVIFQLVDTNDDTIMDVLLFQPEIGANSSNKYVITQRISQKEKNSTTPLRCYSRFVPERTDDYAWENNRVAFRTFGPTAQKMVEDSIEGGTLTSGIDAWLKKVDYPIINKWYEKTVTGNGSYHLDTGEGLDNFHVGNSRGIGGTATKKDSTYYSSKNFISWKTITSGPIRTSFILNYADWNVDDTVVKETKKISLDYGSNFSKYEVTITGVDTLYAGITLHENDGVVTTNLQEGWVSYWEPHFNSELGMAIIAQKPNIITVDKYISKQKDKSNLYLGLKVNNTKVVYYAGFGWKERGLFLTKESWQNYINMFKQKINNPLKISIE